LKGARESTDERDHQQERGEGVRVCGGEGGVLVSWCDGLCVCWGGGAGLMLVALCWESACVGGVGDHCLLMHHTLPPQVRLNSW